jgi:predicted DNA-binding transcriptional regulator AlpA
MSANLGWSLTARMSTRRRVRNAESYLGVAMKNSLPPEMPKTSDPQRASSDPAFERAPLANRLLTASEVAAFVGCHEESVRRAYLSGQLKRQRFGVRSCRFDPTDVRDWIARGAPTRILGEVHRPMRRMGRRHGREEGGAHGCTKDLQA